MLKPCREPRRCGYFMFGSSLLLLWLIPCHFLFLNFTDWQRVKVWDCRAEPGSTGNWLPHVVSLG